MAYGSFKEIKHLANPGWHAKVNKPDLTITGKPRYINDPNKRADYGNQIAGGSPVFTLLTPQIKEITEKVKDSSSVTSAPTLPTKSYEDIALEKDISSYSKKGKKAFLMAEHALPEKEKTIGAKEVRETWSPSDRDLFFSTRGKHSKKTYGTGRGLFKKSHGYEGGKREHRRKKVKQFFSFDWLGGKGREDSPVPGDCKGGNCSAYR